MSSWALPSEVPLHEGDVIAVNFLLRGFERLGSTAEVKQPSSPEFLVEANRVDLADLLPVLLEILQPLIHATVVVV